MMKTARCLVLFAIILSCSGWRSGFPPNFQQQLLIGGGGWLVGEDIVGSSYIVRTDTYGGWKWDGSQWNQIVTQSSMPAANFGWFPTTGTSQQNQNTGGIVEIAQCPANPNIIYMMIGSHIFVSTNGTTIWTATTYAGGSTGNANDTGFRMDGRKMAVDPANCNNVIAGTAQNGIWYTADGGNTWTQITGIPTATAYHTTCSGATCFPGYNIAFDPTTVSGGSTQTVYVFAYTATGGVDSGTLWISTTGVAGTWAQVSGAPAFVSHMVVAPTGGTVWAADNTGVWSYTGGTSGSWTHNLTSGGYHAVAVDPANANHVVAQQSGGALAVSANGSTFTAIGPFSRIANDIPWLAWTNEFFMSSGDIQFDSSQSNLLIFSEGIGVWKTNPPTSGAYNWTSMTKGIEQLVSQQIIAPNGVPIVGVQDRATFTLSSKNASYPTQQTNPNYNSTSVFNQTYSLDWASSNSQFIVALTDDYILGNGNYSGFSTDGGQTFKPFNSYYQNVAASSVSNDGTGKVQITVPSTSGLSTWVNGTGTILHIVGISNTNNVAPIPTLSRFWYATIKSSTQIVLQGSTYTSALSANGNYLVYVDTNPLSDKNGNLDVTAAASDSGVIQLTLVQTSHGLTNNTPICVSGVIGTTEANGCWLIAAYNGNTNTLDLASSTFTNAYVSGGVATTIIPPGGYIAASTPLNIVLVPANNDYPYCTTDGGQTWTQLRVPSGLSTGAMTGWGFAYYDFWQHNIAADRVTPNKFYIYNSGAPTSGNAVAGIYSFTNCNTPTLVNSGTYLPTTPGNSVMRSVPGHAGNLFITAGWIGGTNHPVSTSLYRSTDGGSTITALPNVREVYTMDFGPVAPGATYPTMYITGWVNTGQWTWGTWRSTNADQATPTWTLVAQYPLGSMDSPFALAADGLDWAKCYIGFGGSGYAVVRQNYLLNRDLHHDNDNSPAFLKHVA